MSPTALIVALAAALDSHFESETDCAGDGFPPDVTVTWRVKDHLKGTLEIVVGNEIFEVHARKTQS